MHSEEQRTLQSTLSPSVKNRRSTIAPGVVDDDVRRGAMSQQHLKCFIRPKTRTDGGPRQMDVLLLPVNVDTSLSSWLQTTTLALRQPIRGSLTFPKRAPLGPSAFLVALYALDLSCFPAALTRMRSFDDVKEFLAKLDSMHVAKMPRHSHAQFGEAVFFLQSVDSHGTGLLECAGLRLQSRLAELQLKKDLFDALFLPPNTILPPSVQAAVGGRKQKTRGGKEEEEEEDVGLSDDDEGEDPEGEGEEGAGGSTQFAPTEFASVVRHRLYKLSVCVEACARCEASPQALAEWLLGGGEGADESEQVLTPALWACFAVLCSERCVADPNSSLGPVSALLGCVAQEEVGKRTRPTVVRDQPSSLVKAKDEHSSRFAARRADPRGLGVHFMEQASMTTIDASDDTTFAGAAPGAGWGRLSPTARTMPTVLEGGQQQDGAAAGVSGGASVVSSISGESSNDNSNDGNSVDGSQDGSQGGTGLFKVRYADFNDRSAGAAGQVGFYCGCLSCAPDDDPTAGDEEVYGLGAVRYWWNADFSRFQVQEAYKVGGLTTDVSQVRRVALGEPASKVLRRKPGDAAKQRRRLDAALKEKKKKEKQEKKMASGDKPGQTPLVNAGNKEQGEGNAGEKDEEDGDEEGEGGESEEAANERKLRELLQSLQVCSDPKCLVRRAELLRASSNGNKLMHEGGLEHSHDEKKAGVKGGGGGGGGSKERPGRGKGMAAVAAPAEPPGGGKSSPSKSRQSVRSDSEQATLAEVNPLLAMAVGFAGQGGDEQQRLEGGEADGLTKVALPEHDPLGTNPIRVDLLDTLVANGVVARMWVASGKGLVLGDGDGEGGDQKKTKKKTKTKEGGGGSKEESRGSDASSVGSSKSSKSASSSSVASSVKLPQINGKRADSVDDASVGSSSTKGSRRTSDGTDAGEGGEGGGEKADSADGTEKQQYFVSWESLVEARKVSPWHGPFTSDGNARRHLSTFLDFKHVVFEVCLRIQFARHFERLSKAKRREAFLAQRKRSRMASVQANAHAAAHVAALSGADAVSVPSVVSFALGQGGDDDDDDEDALSEGGGQDDLHKKEEGVRNVKEKNKKKSGDSMTSTHQMLGSLPPHAPLTLLQRLRCRDQALRRQEANLLTGRGSSDLVQAGRIPTCQAGVAGYRAQRAKWLRARTCRQRSEGRHTLLGDKHHKNSDDDDDDDDEEEEEEDDEEEDDYGVFVRRRREQKARADAKRKQRVGTAQQTTALSRAVAAAPVTLPQIANSSSSSLSSSSSVESMSACGGAFGGGGACGGCDDSGSSSSLSSSSLSSSVFTPFNWPSTAPLAKHSKPPTNPSSFVRRSTYLLADGAGSNLHSSTLTDTASPTPAGSLFRRSTLADGAPLPPSATALAAAAAFASSPSGGVAGALLRSHLKAATAAGGVVGGKGGKGQTVQPRVRPSAGAFLRGPERWGKGYLPPSKARSLVRALRATGDEEDADEDEEEEDGEQGTAQQRKGKRAAGKDEVGNRGGKKGTRGGHNRKSVVSVVGGGGGGGSSLGSLISGSASLGGSSIATKTQSSFSGSGGAGLDSPLVKQTGVGGGGRVSGGSIDEGVEERGDSDSSVGIGGEARVGDQDRNQEGAAEEEEEVEILVNAGSALSSGQESSLSSPAMIGGGGGVRDNSQIRGTKQATLSSVGFRVGFSVDMQGMSDNDDDDGDDDKDGEDHYNDDDDDDLDLDRVDVLDALVDLSCELFRNRCVRNDQLTQLLELLLTVGSQNDDDESSSVCDPRTAADAASREYLERKKQLPVGGGEDESKEAAATGEDEAEAARGTSQGTSQGSSGHTVDPEALLVLCRLLLTGVGACLESAGQSADVSSFKDELQSDAWYEKELELASDDRKAAQSARYSGWRTSLPSGVAPTSSSSTQSQGGGSLHAKAPNLAAAALAAAASAGSASGGVSGGVNSTLQSSYAPASLLAADYEARHVAPLGRVLRRISAAAAVAAAAAAASPAVFGGASGGKASGGAGVMPPPSSSSSVFAGCPSPPIYHHNKPPPLQGWRDDHQYHDNQHHDNQGRAGDDGGSGGQEGLHAEHDSEGPSPESWYNGHDDASAGAAADIDAGGGRGGQAGENAEIQDVVQSASRFLLLCRLYRWDVRLAAAVDSVGSGHGRRRGGAKKLAKGKHSKSKHSKKESETGHQQQQQEEGEETGGIQMHGYTSGTFRALPLRTERSEREALAAKEAAAEAAEAEVEMKRRGGGGGDKREETHGKEKEVWEASSGSQWGDSGGGLSQLQNGDGGGGEKEGGGVVAWDGYGDGGGEEEEGGEEEGGGEGGGHDTWTCPVSGRYMWREERAAYLLEALTAAPTPTQPTPKHVAGTKDTRGGHEGTAEEKEEEERLRGSRAFVACWVSSFEALKKSTRVTHARRKALLLHRQAHVPFLSAVASLCDTQGDEQEAFRRLGDGVRDGVEGRAATSRNGSRRRSRGSSNSIGRNGSGGGTGGGTERSEGNNFDGSSNDSRGDGGVGAWWGKVGEDEEEEKEKEVEKGHSEGCKDKEGTPGASKEEQEGEEEEEEEEWGAWGPPRCGGGYKAEMELGVRVVGAAASKWLSEKRVRKDWGDILAKRKELSKSEQQEVDGDDSQSNSWQSNQGPKDLAGWW